MGEIDRDAYDRYVMQSGIAEKLAEDKRLEKQLEDAAQSMYSAADEAERKAPRERIVRLVFGTCERAAGVANGAADGFFEKTTGKGAAVHAQRVTIGQAEGQVRYAADRMFRDGDTADFARRMQKWTALQTRGFANDAMYESVAAARKSGMDIRYAHVPTSTTPCTFCCEMASYGFRFKKRAKKELHHGCKCRLVPGFEGDTLSGYDPDEYRGPFRDGASSRKAVSSAGFSGDFGSALEPTRKLYRNAKNPSTILMDRRGASVEFDRAFDSLDPETRASVCASIDHAIGFVGGKSKNLRMVNLSDLDDGVLAEMRRRGDDGAMYLDRRMLGELSHAEIEQIVFHEMAHAAEWRFTAAIEWDDEAQMLYDAVRRHGTIPMSTGTSEAMDALTNAGFRVRYDQENGIIKFTGDGRKLASEISPYATEGAEIGHQSSELIAESIRYVAVNGYGKNAVADAIARRFVR